MTHTTHMSQASRRKDHLMRVRIGSMLDAGFSISGRDPVRLERGTQVYEVRGKLLIQAKP